MNNKLFFGLIVLAAGLLVGWFMFGGSVPSLGNLTGTQTEEMPTPTQAAGFPFEEESTGTGTMEDKGGVVARTVVTYTNTGFAPLTVTIKQGTTVTFVNESTKGMWIASAVHPTHQLLPGFDQLVSVTSGGTYEYTFAKVGTWKYHNHVSPADTGTVRVTQ